MTVVRSEGTVVASRPLPIWPGPISTGIELYSGLMASYQAIYRTQPNVRLCVRFLARNIAQLMLKAYRRVSSTERQELDYGDPITMAIRQPNPWTTRHRWADAMVHDLEIFDNFYALKVRNPQSRELRQFRLPPQFVRPIGENWLFPDGYELLGTNGHPQFPADAVIHIHGHNPDDARVGLSPIESLRRILAEDAASGEWREQYWHNSARISGVIERPLDAPKWGDTSRKRFREDWQSTWAGRNAEFAAATPVLEEGMTWKPAAFSATDSEYLASRRLSREECAAEYFISPAMVGILENANFANIREQHTMLYQDTLGPRLDQIEEELQLQLLPEFSDAADVYLEHNLAEKLKGSFEEETKALQVATGGPWMTRNEARARRNLPPVEGGDELITPLNVLIGGQASPRDTAPPPGASARPVPVRIDAPAPAPALNGHR